MLATLGAIAGILLVDLAMSADNSIGIGAAAARLQGAQRRLAILFGGVGALVLRVVFAALATYLLQVPGLRALGGILLLFVAYKIIRDTRALKGGDSSKRTQGTLRAAILTIVVADVSTSLDNMLAVGAMADGSALLVVGGLVFSMAIVLTGATLVAKVLHRLPWLVYVAAAVLLFTAWGLVSEDTWVLATLANIGSALA